ncbi:ABC transporter substrate-binding protein [Acetobacter oeni]|uniref:ABC transporter substrate-binding protein n=1 Tax=Acetobacter oeni TaxID=304077 RepID=A0A511XNS1_9PROT|nr:ABC transporter substrate-binding protein [Acetobacter oeni]NHO20364.1 ABC transporter substrate-binding protein [Acetobacter oeni]GBR09883.1 ABC transporter periplasmic protein [Acetobacter oeni LMG 21952]GEN64585.1 ABC transporter substrate-binding protein [Acetobacter oeni]
MLSRRDMMKQGALLVAAGGAVLRSCPVRAASPVRGGHVRVASTTGSLSDTLDPARQSMVTDYIRGAMFYDGLVMLDETQVPRPALAERIDSDDFRTWTLRLRSGVQFHDGATLTSADVVYSLLRHLDPLVASQVRFQAAAMRSVRADGPLTVIIELYEPNISFPSVLGMSNFAIIRDGTKNFATANGTGPFRCAAFQPGIRSLAVRSPDFWKTDGAWMDSIEVISISDDMARHNALLSGDVDIITEVNPRLVALLRRRDMGVMESPTGTYTDFAIRQDIGPGKNADFIQAMKCLFNRDQIADSVWLGFCRLGNDQPLPPEDRYYNHDLPQTTFDPERAKWLLRKSGFLNQTLPPLICSPAANASVDIAVLLQNEASRIGLRLDVRRMPADGYWSQSWMHFPLGFGNINASVSADMTFAVAFASAAPWNESHWRSPRFDQLLVLSRREADEEKRKAIYHEMQTLIHNESGLCIPNFITSLDGYHRRIRGLHPYQGGHLMGNNFSRFIWVDDEAASRQSESAPA